MPSTSVKLTELSAHQQGEQGYFLDTSVQWVRLAGLVRQRTSIESLLEKHPTFVSSTVFREFQLSFLTAFQYVADVLRDVQEDAPGRMGELTRYILDHGGLFGERQAKRILMVLSMVQDYFEGDDAVSSNDIADFCEDECERYRKWRFFTVGTRAERRDLRDEGTYLDPLNCSVARDPLDPAKPAARRPSCDKETRACAVMPAINAHLPAMSQMPDSWRRRRPSSARALEMLSKSSGAIGRRGALGQRLCWPIGDLLIASECPPGVELVSMDQDFVEIAEVLDISVLHLRKG